jgi:signal transduction histidine kinase
MGIVQRRRFIKLFFISFAAALVMIAYGVLQNTKESKIDEFLDVTMKNYNTLYGYTFNHYEDFAHFLYADLLLTPQIKKTLIAIRGADSEQKKVLRKKLYSTLEPKFRNLQGHSLNHLYILEPDSTVFLRVHKVEKFGDDASTYRSLIPYVQAEKKPYGSYENGKHGGAFRFVFPIIEDREFLGMLEATFSETSLMHSFLSHYDIYANIWIKKVDIDKKIFPYYQDHYIPSNIPGYYFKRDIRDFIKQNDRYFVPQTKSEQSLMETLVKEMVAQKKIVSAFDEASQSSITLIPIIHKIEREVLAFIAVKTPAPYINNLVTLFYPLFFFLAFLIVALVAGLYLAFYKSKMTQWLLDAQSSIIVITDGKELKMANKRLLSYFGYETFSEFKKYNKCVCDYFIEDKQQGYISSDNWLEKVLQTQQKDEKLSCYMLSYDNKPNVFQIEAEALEMGVFVATFSNITALVKQKQEIEHLNASLEQKIKKSVEESRQKDQMIQQQSKLASMGEMIGAIAHQWRQPLNALNINIQNLEEDYEEGLIDEAFIDKFINKNRSTIEFMSKTIDDFRNFFRINKEKKSFSVQKAIHEVLSIQSATFLHNNITVELEGEDFEVEGYESEFIQVLLNIISNAKDAILENNIQNGTIKITTGSNSVEIEDDAGGISFDILDRIFEPYFTTKDQGKGTGMGLYMCKMIIEQNMQGTLRVANSGLGAVFTIEF